MSYIPAIRSLVVETKGNGYMSTGTQAGYDARVLTLPSGYRPSAERSVCLYSNAQIKMSASLRVQADGVVIANVTAAEPMNGYGWPKAKVLILL